MRITPWSDRELAFGKGLDELPVLLERVNGTAARLVQLTAHVPRERLHLRPFGRWSVAEHIGHLIYLQDRLDERVDDFAARRPELCWIDLSHQGPVVESHRNQDLGDLIEEFRLKRDYFVRRVKELDPGAVRHRAVNRCRGVSMTIVDTVLYVADHDDHHLASMRSILFHD